MGRYLGRCSSEECNRAVWDDGDGYYDYSDYSEWLCKRCRYNNFRHKQRGPESFPEARFLEAWLQRFGGEYIIPQFWIGQYRVDFALPQAMIVIEIDGQAAHSGPVNIMRDQVRQQNIESVGWRFIRFTASEINSDTDKCVLRTAQLICEYIQQDAQ